MCSITLINSHPKYTECQREAFTSCCKYSYRMTSSNATQLSACGKATHNVLLFDLLFIIIIIIYYSKMTMSTPQGNFDVSLTVHNSVTLANDQLDTQIFKYIYYNFLHVSSNNLLILRRSNCINTASGIVTY